MDGRERRRLKKYRFIRNGDRHGRNVCGSDFRTVRFHRSSDRFQYRRNSLPGRRRRKRKIVRRKQFTFHTYLYSYGVSFKRRRVRLTAISWKSAYTPHPRRLHRETDGREKKGGGNRDSAKRVYNANRPRRWQKRPRTTRRIGWWGGREGRTSRIRWPETFFNNRSVSADVQRTLNGNRITVNYISPRP